MTTRQSSLARHSTNDRKDGPQRSPLTKSGGRDMRQAISAIALADDDDQSASEHDDARSDHEDWLQWPEAESERQRDDFADELAAAWAGDQISARRTRLDNESELLDHALRWNNGR